MTNPFDDRAGSWDDHPGRRRMADGIFDALCRRIPLQSGWNVLDYGAGTGLLTLALAPRVNQLQSACSLCFLPPSLNIGYWLLDIGYSAPPVPLPPVPLPPVPYIWRFASSRPSTSSGTFSPPNPTPSRMPGDTSP